MTDSPRWTLHLGDCLEGMASLPDKSVDHVICDPPYGAEAHTPKRRVLRTGGNHYGPMYRGQGGVAQIEVLPFGPISDSERNSFAINSARIASRWVIVFCQAEAVSAWRDSMNNAGLVFKRAGVWVKPDAQPNIRGDGPGVGYESIVFAHSQGLAIWNGGGKTGVYTFNKNESNARRHPTQKPLALMESLVRDFTDPGEMILDPFAGSGTTGVAAIRLGRRFLGWEKDPTFHTAAIRRLEAAREQLTLPIARAKRPKQGTLPGAA